MKNCTEKLRQATHTCDVETIIYHIIRFLIKENHFGTTLLKSSSLASEGIVTSSPGNCFIRYSA